MNNLKVPAKWDIDADVVIVGSGGAGMSAAIEAARAGSKVVVLEAAQTAGGSTTLCGGTVYLGGGTGLQKSCGIEDTMENFHKYLSAAMGPSANQEKIKLFCEKGPETYDWLVSLGVPFKPVFVQEKVTITFNEDSLYYSGNEQNYPYNTFAKPAPRGHQAAGYAITGAVLWKPIHDAAVAAGAEIIYQASATDLVVNNGRVVGVRADIEDAEKFVRAGKAVILCAGGFQANKEMLVRYASEFVELPKYLGTEYDDGTGIQMGQAVGASLRGMNAGASWHFLYPPASKCKGILVNGQGQRIVDEACYGSTMGRQIFRKGDKIAYLMYDSKVSEEITQDIEKAAKQPELVMLSQAAGVPPETFAGQCPAYAEAPTIRELAEKLKIDPDALESTVTLYNKYVAKEEDPQFHKAKKYLTVLDKGPFFAIDMCSVKTLGNSSFITLGGLETDLQSRVLDVKGNPIPGLYAAGRNSSGIQGEEYNSGTSTADGIIFGRIAGQNASKESAAK